jgi:micrococcal nuclease
MYEYRALITRVVDGDTVWAEVDLGCDVRIKLTLRLAGINAPELSTAEGVAARGWLVERLARSENRVTVHTIKDKREKYGRYLAFLVQGEADINELIVAAGHAVPYP